MDDLVKRLRKVQWSVNGEPCADGNVDETCAAEAADRIEAQDALLREAREAFEEIDGVDFDAPSTWKGNDVSWQRRRAFIMQRIASDFLAKTEPKP